MIRVEWHSLAQSDLLDAAAFLEGRRPKLGGRFIDRVNNAIETLRMFPLVGRPHEVPGYRSLPVRQFPYAVIYRAFEDRLWIAAIRHASRGDWFWTDRRPE